MLKQREVIEELRIIKRAHKLNSSINDQSTVTKASSLYGLDPVLDDNGVLMVGGRLTNSSLKRNPMHRILMPRIIVINKQDY